MANLPCIYITCIRNLKHISSEKKTQFGRNGQYSGLVTLYKKELKCIWFTKTIALLIFSENKIIWYKLALDDRLQK